jgi:FkbM family methyltransferase
MSQKIKDALKKRLPSLAAAYREIRDRRQSSGEPQATPFSFKMAGNSAMQAGSFEPDDTALFRKLAANVDTVVNAGANIGYYCLHALQLGKHVIAFEPIPLNVAVLLKNISANGWQNDAEIFPLALAEKPGILPIYGGGTGASLVKGWAGFHPGKPTLVPVSSFDAVLGDRLSGSKTLVLIDVEGSEYELLKGARKLLAMEPRPVWIVEIVRTEHQPSGRAANPNFLPTFDLFWAHGYEAYGIGEEIHPLERQVILADWDRAKKGLSANFIFVHKTSRGVLTT